MYMIMTKPTRPTIANTKPEATLFCKKDVSDPRLVGGTIEGESTTTVVTAGDEEELEILSVEEVVETMALEELE